MQELTIGLMIMLGRNLLTGDSIVRAAPFKGWKPILYGKGLEGAAVGVTPVAVGGRVQGDPYSPWQHLAGYRVGRQD